jgi:GNAT superfamily N-acetyltransferase
VGTVHLQREGDEAHLGLFVVQPTLQGRGIGKVFLEAAERFVHLSWGSGRMTMQVISVRDELIAYYERRGYGRTGQRKPFPDAALSTPLVPGLEFEVLAKDLTGSAERLA